ncbi:MAG: hypothetical protein IPN18_05720 [Ignavibacteriales bacterium]|nr:hypothetical protein [Ignavibacteriales bacterium]
MDTTLVVPENVKLKIEAGAKLTFNNYGKLLVWMANLRLMEPNQTKLSLTLLQKLDAAMEYLLTDSSENQ